jgi:hypothetical protein
MDRAIVAEWIMARITNESRASEIIGDLLEARPAQGNLRFWFSVLVLLFALGWRPLLGLVFAYAFAIFCFFQESPTLMKLNKQRFHFPFGSTEYLTSVRWLFLTERLGQVTILLWIVAGFSMVRFGIRTISSRMSVGTALMGMVLYSYLWIPAARPALLATSALALLIVLFKERWRQSVGIVLATVAIGWVVADIGLTWAPFGRPSAFRIVPVFTAIPIVEAAAFTYLHRAFATPVKNPPIETL